MYVFPFTHHSFVDDALLEERGRLGIWLVVPRKDNYNSTDLRSLDFVYSRPGADSRETDIPLDTLHGRGWKFCGNEPL